MVTYETSLSTIGVQENTAYKTAATADRMTGTMSAATGDYDPDKTYYVATSNRLSQDEVNNLYGNDNNTKFYQLSSYAAGATNQKITNEHGYEITESKYISLTNEEKAACKVYKEVTATERTDASITKYALSYAQVPNQVTYQEFNTQGTQMYNYTSGGSQSSYSYKASNGKAFTLVDPQYSESFLNAGLDSSDFYQYEASSGIRFVKREDVENNLNNESRTITTFAVTTIEKVTKNSINDATIEFDASGRISTITDEQGHTYTMTATTETDNVAYDDAYNQYEYNQYVYDQKQNEINANIEILQAQDKSLELRLSTLDTQHSAIQTELEAVKKVMSKNIDNSFKTFNA